MHRDNFHDCDATRATTNAQLVYQVIAAARPSPMDATDVLVRLPLEPTSIYTALKHLRAGGFLRYAAGSKRKHELVPGRAMPQDGRGKAGGSQAARLRIARLRRIAARPLSQFTATGKLKSRRARLRSGVKP